MEAHFTSSNAKSFIPMQGCKPCTRILNFATTCALALLLLLPAVSRAQDIVEIGTGTSTYYVPMPGWYGWQYDVYLYTPSDAEELNSSALITSIAYNISSSSTSTGAEMTIYMKDVEPTYTLSSNTTFSTYISGATQVYQTSSFSSTTGWNTFPFSNQFQHEGGKAILVAIWGVGCGTSGGCSRQCFYTSVANSHWYKRKDGSDPGTSVTGTLDAYRSNIRLGMQLSSVSCSLTGSGTSSSPYLIYNADDMSCVRQMVNNEEVNSSTCFKVMDNLSLTGWSGLGSSSKPFRGVFDGNGKTITISGSQGLFAYVEDATIHDVNVAGSISGGLDIAGVAGTAVNSTIRDCRNAASITTSSYCAGGIVGRADTTSISGCSNSGNIVSSYTSNNALGGLGGIVGYAYGDAPSSMTLVENATFESGNDGWTLVNGSQINYWVRGTATSNGGSYSMYVTNDGSSNAYTTSSASSVWIYKDIYLPANSTLTFDWKGYGESTFDYMCVYVGPTTGTPTAGTGTYSSGWTGSTNLDGTSSSGKFNLSSTWGTKTYDLGAYTGLKRVSILWRNDGSSGTPPPGAIDNIRITARTYQGEVVICSNCTNTGNVSSPTSYGYYTGGIAGQIEHLGFVSNCENSGNITGYYYTGGIVGCSKNTQAPSLALTSNTNTGQVKGYYYTGGVVGCAVGTQITACENEGSVMNSSYSTSNSNTGGIAGAVNYFGSTDYTSNSAVEECVNSGPVSGYNYTGGIVGQARNNASFSRNVNEGDITARSSYAGGIVGYAYNASGTTVNTTQNVNKGDIASTAAYVGGIAGELYGNSSPYSTMNGDQNAGRVSTSYTSTGYIGGVVGYAYYTYVDQCVNVGEVAYSNGTGSSYAGGIVGYGSSASARNCLNAGPVSGYSYVGGIVGDGATSQYCLNVGNVTGRSTSYVAAISGSTTPTSSYADKQMCPTTYIYGTTSASGSTYAKTTSELTSGGLPSGFSSANWTTSADLYPRPAAIANSDVALLAASPVFLRNNETVNEVATCFSASTANNVSWSADPYGCLSLYDSRFVIVSNGESTLTAERSDVRKYVQVAGVAGGGSGANVELVSGNTCGGTNIQLQVSLPAGISADSYQWYRDGSAISGATSSVLTTIAPYENATYSVSVQTSDCPMTGQYDFVYDGIPDMRIGSDVSGCVANGDEVTLSVVADDIRMAEHASEYTFSVSNRPFETLTSSNTTISTGDDAYTTVNLGFTFNYCGTNYTQATVATNGYIQLGATSGGTFTNDLTSTTYVPAIAAWWDDINATAAYVQTQGTAPNRVFIFHTQGTRLGNSTYPYAYQIRLYERTNVIEIHYGSNFSYMSGTSASIGINSNNGSLSYISVTPTGNGTATTSSTTANNSVGDTQADYLTSGTVYTFSPGPQYSYAWTANNVAVGGDAESLTTAITENTTYCCTVSNDAGCQKALAPVPVSVMPQIEMSAPGAICEGNSATLTITNANQFSSIQWSTGSTSSSITVAPSVTTDYTVTATTSAGCQNVKTVTLPVLSYPSPAFTVDPLPTTCLQEGSNITLSLAAPNSNTEIGNGTSTTYCVPVNNHYNYTYSQMLYTPEEIGGSGDITSIGFEYGYTSPSTAKNNVKIYMGEISKTEFAGTTATDFVTSDLTLVYTGNLNCSQGWNDFAMSTPFHYSGNANLVVAIMDNSGGYNSSTYIFRSTPTAHYSTLAYYSDSYQTTSYASPNTSMSQSRYQYRPNTRFAVRNPLEYSWTFNGEPMENTSSELTANVTESGTYTVQVSQPGGYCPTSYSQTVSIMPRVEIVASPNVVCEGGSTMLSLQNPEQFANISWSTGETTNSITVSPNATTTYTLSVTYYFGCAGEGSREVEVKNYPTVSMAAPVPDLPCQQEGSDITLSLIVPNSNPVVGNETSPTYFVPVNNFYKYTYSQMLYTPEEIGGSGDITSIGFEYGYTSPSTAKNNVEIYMGETDKTAFGSSEISEFITEGLTLVYSGSLNCSQGWNDFTLTTPFHYSGNSNLVVAVMDNSGAYNSSSYVFKTTATDNYSSISRYSDDSQTTDIASPNSGMWAGYYQYRPNTRFYKPFHYEYAWYANEQQLNSAESSMTHAPIENTTYTAIVTNGGDCPVTLTQNVAVMPRVEISSTEQNQCPGETVTLSLLNPEQFTTATWSNQTTGMSTAIEPLETGVHTVTATAHNGCVGTASTTVAVLNYPAVTYTTQPETTTCVPEGTEVTLNAMGVGTGDVQVGEGTATTGAYPINRTYNYSVAQQIYTAEEIHRAGAIRSIAFYSNQATATNLNVRVFMKHTDRTGFASTTDYESISASDLVYSGTYSFSSIGWATITLDRPFVYNGEDNLLICFDDNTGGWSTRNFYAYTPSTSDYRGVCYYSDATNIDPYDLPAGTSSRATRIAQVRLTFPEVTAVWSENGTPIDNDNESTYRFTPETPTTLSVTATEVGNPCPLTFTSEVTTMPAFTISSSNPVICDAGSSTLSVTNPDAFSRVSWSDGTTGDSITVTPDATTTYSATAYTEDGCSHTNTCEVQLLNTPDVTLASSPTSTSCLLSGELVSLYVENGDSSTRAAEYRFSVAEGNYTDIHSLPGAQSVSLGTYSSSDSQYGTITLPSGFDFKYSGQSVTTVYPSTNGQLFLNAGSTSATTALYSMPASYNYIAAFTRDARCDQDLAYYYTTLGTAPNRIFVVQNDGYGYYGNTAEDYFYQSQYWLYEGTNKIEVHYGAVPATTATSSSSVYVGINSYLSGSQSYLSVAPAANLEDYLTSWAGAYYLNTTEIGYLRNKVLTYMPNSQCEFAWTVNGEEIDNTRSALSFEANGDAEYSVSVSNPGGHCPVTFDAMVTTKQAVIASASRSTVCESDTVILRVENADLFESAQWSNGETGFSIVVNPTAATTYTVSATSTTGCISTADVMVNVLAYPENLLSGAPTTECVPRGSELVLSFVSYEPVPAANYNATIAPASYVDITSLPNITVNTGNYTGSNDDGHYTAELPFDFIFNGQTFSTVYPTTNGFLNFNIGTTSRLSLAGNASNFIAAFMRDTEASTDPKYGVMGTAPNRIFVAQYDGWNNYSSEGSSYELHYQYWLYEGTNKIEVHYGNATAYGGYTPVLGLNGYSDAGYSVLCVVPTSQTELTTYSSNTSVPENQTAYLTNTVVTYSMPNTYQYAWSENGNPIEGEDHSITVTPTENTTYEVTVAYPDGMCPITFEMPVTITPDVNYTPNPAYTCPGGTVDITGINAQTFEWRGVTGAPLSTSATYAAENGSYLLLGTDENGCSASTTVRVTEGVPAAGSIFDGIVYGCLSSADGVELLSEEDGTGHAVNYRWYRDGELLDNSNEASYELSAEVLAEIGVGSYTFTREYWDGCSGHEWMTSNGICTLEVHQTALAVEPTEVTLDCGGSVEITPVAEYTRGTGVKYFWYADEACTQLIAVTNDSYTTPALYTGEHNYYVKAVPFSFGSHLEPRFMGVRQDVETWDEAGTYTYEVADGIDSLKLEVWGAQGGSYDEIRYGGRGGYSVGTLTNLEDVDELYLYVGGQPAMQIPGRGVSFDGGFNGGGKGHETYFTADTTYAQGGGGATDIRLFGSTLYNRVIVAGGGSGSTNGSVGYAGGGEASLSYEESYVATLSSPGAGADFGVGGNPTTIANYNYCAPGGGGGWYGGGCSSSYSDSDGTLRNKTAGGSGYVWTAEYASYAPTDYLVPSDYYLVNAQTIAGNQWFPASYPNEYDLEHGHEGDGYVRITAYSPIYADVEVVDTIWACESPVQQVTVTVNPIAAPEVENVVVVCGDNATLVPIATETFGSNNLFYWYADEACTELLAVTDEFTTPTLSAGEYDYYVKQVNYQPIRRTESIFVGYDEQVNDFEFYGEYRYQVLPNTVSMKMEVWGAQGGYDERGDFQGGMGGYSVGTLVPNDGDILYVFVGGQGVQAIDARGARGGYNGGGDGGNGTESAYGRGGASGGGATDIRLNGETLNSRIIVAGGGGGTGSIACAGNPGLTPKATSSMGGSGGGEEGLEGVSSSSQFANGGAGGGGSYTVGGAGGVGQYDQSEYAYSVYYGAGGGGAGGGWYGGGGGAGGGYDFGPASAGYNGGDGTFGQGGAGGAGKADNGYTGGGGGGAGGGSGFVWTAAMAQNVPDGYTVSTSYFLNDALTLTGDDEFITPTLDGTEFGHSGDGYARITSKIAVYRYNVYDDTVWMCTSDVAHVTVIAEEIEKPFAENVIIQCGIDASLEVLNDDQTDDIVYQWYSDEACTNIIAEGRHFQLLQLFTDTTVYVRAMRHPMEGQGSVDGATTYVETNFIPFTGYLCYSDTSRVSVSLVPLDEPLIDFEYDLEICKGQSVELYGYASYSDDGDQQEIAWYTTPTGGSIAGVSNDGEYWYPTPEETTTYYAATVSDVLSEAGSHTLHTQPLVDRNHFTVGNFFDIVTGNVPMMLDSLDIMVDANSQMNVGTPRLNVYIKQGSCEGAVSTPDQWTLVESFEPTIHQGQMLAIQFEEPINLDAGEEYSIYISSNFNFDENYFSNIAPGERLIADNFLTVNSGYASESGDVGQFPREVWPGSFYGALHYTLAGEILYGCVSATRVPVEVVVDEPSESPSEIIGDDIVCNGNEIRLTTDAELGDNAMYEWFENSIAEENLISNESYVDVAPEENTTYYVRIFSEICGATNAASHDVEVNGSPILGDLNEGEPICDGDALNLTAPDIDFVASDLQLLAYGWQISADDEEFEDWSDTINVPYSVNGRYVRYMVQNTCGVVYSNSVLLTVDTIAVVDTLPQNLVLCDGESLELSEIMPTVLYDGSDEPEITWHMFVNESTEAEEFTEETQFEYGNTYRIFAEVETHCAVRYSDTVEVTVNAAPVVQSIRPYSEAICAGEDIPLAAPEVEENGAETTAHWVISSSLDGMYVDFDITEPAQYAYNGYYVSYVATNHCGYDAANGVQLLIKDRPTIAALNDLFSCTDAPFTFTAPRVTPNGSAVTSQGWQRIVGTDTTIMEEIPEVVTFDEWNGTGLRYFAVNDCDTTYSNIATVTIYPVHNLQVSAQYPLYCPNAHFNVTATSGADNVVYHWSSDANAGLQTPDEGEAMCFDAAVGFHTYSVTATDEHQCVAMGSCEVEIREQVEYDTVVACLSELPYTYDEEQNAVFEMADDYEVVYASAGECHIVRKVHFVIRPTTTQYVTYGLCGNDDNFYWEVNDSTYAEATYDTVRIAYSEHPDCDSVVYYLNVNNGQPSLTLSAYDVTVPLGQDTIIDVVSFTNCTNVPNLKLAIEFELYKDGERVDNIGNYGSVYISTENAVMNTSFGQSQIMNGFGEIPGTTFSIYNYNYDYFYQAFLRTTTSHVKSNWHQNGVYRMVFNLVQREGGNDFSYMFNEAERIGGAGSHTTNILDTRELVVRVNNAEVEEPEVEPETELFDGLIYVETNEMASQVGEVSNFTVTVGMNGATSESKVAMDYEVYRNGELVSNVADYGIVEFNTWYDAINRYVGRQLTAPAGSIPTNSFKVIYYQFDYFYANFWNGTNNKLTANWNVPGEYTIKFYLHERIGGSNFPQLYDNVHYVGGAGSVNAALFDMEEVTMLVGAPTVEQTVNVSVCEAQLPLTFRDTTFEVGTVTSDHDYFYHDEVSFYDTLFHLTITVNSPVNVAETKEECGSYTWNGVEYTESGDYTFAHEDANGCEQVDTLHLTIYNPVHNSTTHTECESYVWNGNEYTQSGVYLYAHNDVHGCEQVDTLYLTINYPVTTDLYDTACISYTWNDVVYTESDDITVTIDAANGCDSIVTLHLVVNNPVHIAFTEEACESYEWNGTEYVESGDYTFEHFDDNGCTQVDTLHLTIYNPVHQSTTEVACSSYVWNGREYTESGVYTYEFPDQHNCTQVDTLYLTINQPVTNDIYEEACISYTWNDNVYTETGEYTLQFEAANHCDSVVTLHLTVYNPVHTAETVVACDSYTWSANGATYTESNDYTFEHEDANGCTQVDTLHLTINQSVRFEFEASADNYYIWNGVTCTESRDYEQTFTAANGCDSIVTLHLTINSQHSESTPFMVAEALSSDSVSLRVFANGMEESTKVSVNFLLYKNGVAVNNMLDECGGYLFIGTEYQGYIQGKGVTGAAGNIPANTFVLANQPYSYFNLHYLNGRENLITNTFTQEGDYTIEFRLMTEENGIATFHTYNNLGTQMRIGGYNSDEGAELAVTSVSFHVDAPAETGSETDEPGEQFPTGYPTLQLSDNDIADANSTTQLNCLANDYDQSAKVAVYYTILRNGQAIGVLRDYATIRMETWCPTTGGYVGQGLTSSTGNIPGNTFRPVSAYAFNFFYLDFFESTTNNVTVQWLRPGEYEIVFNLVEMTGGADFPLTWSPNHKMGGRLASSTGLLLATDTLRYHITAESTAPTGISENGRGEELFSVYPNPTNSTCNVMCSQTNVGADLQLFDAAGKLVMVQKAETQLTTLNVMGLAPGIYVLHLISDGQTIGTQKVVVTR